MKRTSRPISCISSSSHHWVCGIMLIHSVHFGISTRRPHTNISCRWVCIYANTCAAKDEPSARNMNDPTRRYRWPNNWGCLSCSEWDVLHQITQVTNHQIIHHKTHEQIMQSERILPSKQADLITSPKCRLHSTMANNILSITPWRIVLQRNNPVIQCPVYNSSLDRWIVCQSAKQQRQHADEKKTRETNNKLAHLYEDAVDVVAICIRA